MYTPTTALPMPPSGGPAPAAPATYPALVKAGLWLDLVVCSFAVLTAVGATVMLTRKDPSSFDAFRSIGELVIGSGIALFGITGNALLLRRRRSGLLPAALGIAFGVGGIAFAYFVMAGMLDDPETLSCPPETLVAGVVMGTVLRACYNFLYAIVLVHAAKALGHGRQR